MPKFDATINGISLASYGVEPNMATVPQPEAKTYQAEIPGRDGLLDYTDAYGVVRYENRTVTVEAYEIGDITARMEHRRAICSDMHGKTCTLALTTLPGYTFTGRCSVEYDEDGSETTYKLSFDCQPYMSAGERTFVGNCAGGVDLVFMSGDKPVKPRIEVPRYSIIIFNGQQYEVEAGTWTFDGIVFKRGRNEVYINTYTEPGTTTWGDLQSMTWEQIGWHHKTADASGALVNVTDALQARPNKLVVDGKAVQDGTPTPDVPVEIDVVDSPVTVQRCGANLLNYVSQLKPGYSTTNNGVTFYVNDDMSIKITGTSTNTAYFNLDFYNSVYNAVNPVPHGCTLYKESELNGAVIVIGYYEKNGSYATISNAASTFEFPSKAFKMRSYIMVNSGVTVDVTAYPMLNIGSTAIPYEPYSGAIQSITLPSDHNYIASLPDGTRDELVLRSDGVAVLTERTDKIASYAGESVTTSYYSTTGALTTGATVIYAIPIATMYSADNGTTWSTTDPAAGTSAIQLYKGTNNVWCTDALSPNVTLNYDTQERTRKQRVSELYWRKNPPQRRLTWGQLATHTWAEIGSKPVQEWYYSGTADVVENAYINYEIGDL